MRAKADTVLPELSSERTNSCSWIERAGGRPSDFPSAFARAICHTANAVTALSSSAFVAAYNPPQGKVLAGVVAIGCIVTATVACSNSNRLNAANHVKK